MKKVIIYGGAGFIGSAVTKVLCDEGIDVWVVEKKGICDESGYQRIRSLPIHLVECNLEDVEKLDTLINETDFDVFYQFAWSAIDEDALVDYERQLECARCILKSIKIAKQLGCTKFIGAGSITESELFYREGRNYLADKHKYYRVAQLVCDTMGRAISKEIGINFLWPQIINIYGPGEKSARLINTLIEKLLTKEKMKLSKGNQLYDFLYITDAAKAFAILGERGVVGKEYVIGSGKSKQLKTYLRKVRDIVAPEMELDMSLEYTGFHLKQSDLQISALREIGFEAEVEFDEGIVATQKWLEECLRN